MENGENVNQGSQSPDISTPPDPTQAMPPFPEGAQVDSMSVADAQTEWQNMTLDKDGKYANWPRSVFNERRDKLYDRGFAARDEEARKVREAESERSLRQEIEKIEERDEREDIRKSRSALVQHFHGEKEADAAIKAAKSIFKRFATRADIVFVEKSGLGNDPEFIQKLAEIGDILKRGAYKKR